MIEIYISGANERVRMISPFLLFFGSGKEIERLVKIIVKSIFCYVIFFSGKIELCLIQTKFIK